ncbi:protein FAM117B-like [Diadema setosum]|uniref:protein FAM117B-like n=1 Tax=Diadema setosum TaxID=31175 RepID=UPI003B3B8F59
MSTQAHSRLRRNASPRGGPQPIRATHPFTLRQGSPTRSSNGRRSSPGPASSPTATQPWPSSSDTHKTKHRSSDHRTSPERSPSSPGFKVEKPKAVRASPAPQIRRTSSLDTIAVPYLAGHWPRSETFTSYTGLYGPNQKHQSTQTDDSKRSSSWGSADNLKEKYKQQLRKQGSRQSSSSAQRASPVHANHSTVANLPSPVSTSASSSLTSTSNSSSTASSQTSIPTPPPVTSSSSSSTSSSFQQVSVSTSLIGQAHTLPRSTAIPVPNTLRAPPVPRIRGSVEGLNQEVEKLVLSGNDREERPQVEPLRDGHRAPIPGTANMQTQTPAETREDEGSDPGSRNQSISPTFVMDSSRPSSRSSSTGNGDTKVDKGECSPEYHFGAKYSSSPSHNKSWQLTRDPPDGCERPQKTRDEASGIKILDDYSALSYCPDGKQSLKLKQSDNSAFCAILPNFPQGEFTKAHTLTSSSAQTQTVPPTQVQQTQTTIQVADTNGTEINGSLE